MNKSVFVSLIAVSIVLCACSKPPVPEIPPPTPTPPPTPPPTPKPPRLAPAGIFYLLKYKSITTESGVTGLPPGTEVKRILEDVSGVKVSTKNGVEIVVEARDLTNDLDVAFSVATDDSRKQLLLAAAKAQADGSIQIIQATYGAGSRFADVTGLVRAEVLKGNRTIYARGFGIPDPAFGSVKTLTIVYSIGGSSPISVSAGEGQSITLPATAPSPTYSNTEYLVNLQNDVEDRSKAREAERQKQISEIQANIEKARAEIASIREHPSYRTKIGGGYNNQKVRELEKKISDYQQQLSNLGVSSELR